MAATSEATSQDKRLKILDATIRKQNARQDALIAILHKAQELFGYLEPAVLKHVARALRLPPSRVQGVATFYHLFRLKPQGDHTCVVCLGTACFVKGAQKLIQTVEKTSGIKTGETTADHRISLIVARCIGACGIAPAVVLDEITIGHMTPEILTTHLQEWMNGPR